MDYKLRSPRLRTVGYVTARAGRYVTVYEPHGYGPCGCPRLLHPGCPAFTVVAFTLRLNLTTFPGSGHYVTVADSYTLRLRYVLRRCCLICWIATVIYCLTLYCPRWTLRTRLTLGRTVDGSGWCGLDICCLPVYVYIVVVVGSRLISAATTVGPDVTFGRLI